MISPLPQLEATTMNSRAQIRRTIGLHLTIVLVALLTLPAASIAQTRVMPVGDSITNGGNNHVSYRYELWFALEAAGYDVDFVGRRTTLNANSTPNPAWYPDYDTVFDRDHEGYWGWRTDELAGVIIDAATLAAPDVVLVHLGTNDIGQQGAAGVTNADTNLRLLIDRLRSVDPDVTILLAQIIEIGPGNGYSANADQVVPLNAVIAAIASDKHTEQSPVILVDQNTDFVVGSMLQADGIHPNLAGEAQMSDVWESALATVLPPGNPPPTIDITAPTPGTSFTQPGTVTITADASDSNGLVTEVRFYEGANLLGTDTMVPWSIDWINPPLGSHVLTAEADDDGGRTATSDPVAISVVLPGASVPVFVSNPSFEEPALIDGDLANGPGSFGGWVFTATPSTFLGIFNPPAESYSSAEGNAAPAGADGSNVAYLFNDGGPTESVETTQLLGENLIADTQYTLSVAIGKFLPDQPYSFSVYGGYVIELLAGSTAIAMDSGTVEPNFDEFRNATVTVNSQAVDPGLVGQPLTIRLGIATNEEDRSTHFDDVRLERQDTSTSAPALGLRHRLEVHPNPSNPRATVVLEMGSDTHGSLSIYDAAGRLVKGVFQERRLSAGTHRIPVELPGASGAYYVRLTTADGTLTRKLMSIK